MESLRAGHGLVHARADEARIAFCLKGLARVAAAQGSHERALRGVSAGRAMSLQQAVAFAAQPDAGSTGMGTDEEGSVKSHDPTGPRRLDSAKREIVKR